MKNSETCEIEQTVKALEQAIENKKIQMHRAQIQSGSSPSNVMPHLFSTILNRVGGSYAPISQVLEKSGEFVRNFIKNIQQNVEERPWETVRKVAAFSFGIGLFLSQRHKSSASKGESPREEKE